MRVENRMQKDLITITKGESIKTAIDLIRERRIRHLPVVEGKELVGILTERDVRPFYPASVSFLAGRASDIGDLLDRLEKTKVEEIMVKEVTTVKPDNTFEYASHLLHEKKIGALPVVKGKELVGIITESDILDAFLEVLGTKTPSSLLEIETSNRSGTLEGVCRIARDHNAEVISTYTTPASRGGTERNLVIRLNIPHADHLVGELQKEGCKVLSCTTSG